MSPFLSVIVIIFLLLLSLRIFLRYFIFLCTSDEQMNGKTVIVTGANSGIGYHVAKKLAQRGARVILACRNDNRGITARDKIIVDTGNTDVVYKNLDLASLSSVKKFCDDIIKTEKRLDVLVNNAGVFGFGERYTEDGILEGMQINYFGQFLLTELLVPLLRKTRQSKVVNVSSLLHYLGNFKVDYMNKSGHYMDLLTYSNSKMCNMAYTVELAERLKGEVAVNAVHPGVVYTSITDNVSMWNLPNFFTYFLFLILVWVCRRSAEEAAQPIVAACLDSEGRTGKFLVDGSTWPYSWRCSNRMLRISLYRTSEDFVSGKVSK